MRLNSWTKNQVIGDVLAVAEVKIRNEQGWKYTGHDGAPGFVYPLTARPIPCFMPLALSKAQSDLLQALQYDFSEL